MVSEKSIAARAGVAVLTLASLVGCSLPGTPPPQPAKDPEEAHYVDRGHGIYFVNTTYGPEASQAIAEILDRNPGKTIAEIERTGTYNDVDGGGAGFIVRLEEATK